MPHGLDLCCNASNTNIIEVINIPNVLDVLSIVLEIEKETFLLALVCHMLGPYDIFIDNFVLLINEPSTQYRILIAGDYNLDQTLPENVAKVDPLIQNLTLSQDSQYSIRIHWGTLDLLFDTPNSNTVSSLPLPYSDNFVFVFSNLMHYVYTEFSFQPFTF